mgnify:CR=1
MVCILFTISDCAFASGVFYEYSSVGKYYIGFPSVVAIVTIALSFMKDEA